MAQVRTKFPTSLVERAAHMFWVERKKKFEIGNELGKNGTSVNEILEQAIDQKIVRIQIHSSVFDSLAKTIQDRHGLKRAMIARGPETQTDEDADNVFRRFGRLAAGYFKEEYDKHPPTKPFHVGVTGGLRVLNFASAVEPGDRPNIVIHATALVGRSHFTEYTSEIEPSVPASVLWTRCGAHPNNCEYETVEPYRIARGSNGRAVVEKELLRLGKLPSIRNVIRNMGELDIAFAGFGAVKQRGDRPSVRHRFGMEHLLKDVVSQEQLSDEGAVGDFNYCLFDSNGRCPRSKKWDFFVAAGHYSQHRGVAFYRNLVRTGKTVVGFGGAPYLLPAIRAALKGELLNVLIIDEYSARLLAEEA